MNLLWSAWRWCLVLAVVILAGISILTVATPFTAGADTTGQGVPPGARTHQPPAQTIPAPRVPAARWAHWLVWDRTEGRLLLGGGRDAGGAEFTEVWSYQPATQRWAELATGPAVPIMNGARAVWDDVDEQVLIFGGRADEWNNLWSYQPRTNTWRHLSSGELPPGRYQHTMVWAPSTRELLIFGGRIGSATTSDLWVYRVADAQWERRQPPALPPSVAQHDAVWDEEQGVLLSFAGCCPVQAQVWRYEARTNRWELDVPTGEAAPARVGHAAVWDAEARQMLVLGGGDWVEPIVEPPFGPSGGPGGFRFRAFADLWSYQPDRRTWTEVVAPNPPPERYNHAVAWDPRSRQLYLFGGSCASAGCIRNDLWAFQVDAGRWLPLDP
jgi:hypothetical protein